MFNTCAVMLDIIEQLICNNVLHVHSNLLKSKKKFFPISFVSCPINGVSHLCGRGAEWNY